MQVVSATKYSTARGLSPVFPSQASSPRRLGPLRGKGGPGNSTNSIEPSPLAGDTGIPFAAGGQVRHGGEHVARRPSAARLLLLFEEWQRLDSRESGHRRW